ncbi:hypothetical protein PG996_003413 [Apiospora saccharicola]|uniref:Uncharacterized protein n=1 Tax=Apiospora saccharicola TaxID=335842 RepID=A0ABR1W179_9PEZI
MQPYSDQYVSPAIATSKADQEQNSLLELAVLIKWRTEDALRIVNFVKDRYNPDGVYGRLGELHQIASNSLGRHGESRLCDQVDAKVPLAAVVLSQLVLLKVYVPKEADTAANMSDEERQHLEQILREETKEGEHTIVAKPDTALFATIAAMKDLDTNICALKKLSRELGRAIRDHDSKDYETLLPGEDNSSSMDSVAIK